MYQYNYATLGRYHQYKVSWRYLPRENYLYSNPNPADRYLKEVDKLLERTLRPYTGSSDDLVSVVFANQAAKHQLSSYQLAGLIQERREMAGRHKKDIGSRLMDMFEARSITRMLNPADGGRRVSGIERQIVDLERQEHDVELGLWKDTLELRSTLLNERGDYQATRRRINLLSGGDYGRI